MAFRQSGFRLNHARGIDQLTLQGGIFVNSIGDSLLQPSLTAPFTRLDIASSKEKGGNIRLRWDRNFSGQSSIMLQT